MPAAPPAALVLDLPALAAVLLGAFADTTLVAGLALLRAARAWALLDGRDAVIPEDLQAVGEWLDSYPNFYVDIDARISELGRQPYSARRFIMK